MALSAAWLFADENGETHFRDLEIEVPSDPAAGGVAHLSVPTMSTLYVEYPVDRSEMVPGLHPAPQRQFVLSLRGAFEIQTSTGDSRVFRPGDWCLVDDVGSRGHTTKQVGSDRRVNVFIVMDPDWKVPT
jgi:hypothetical protein